MPITVTSPAPYKIEITPKAARPIEIKRVGTQGPANSLSIGTVEKGDEAAATITGDAPSQTLNLTLPKGDTGDTGPGVPNGGSTNQVLAKASSTDQDTQWVDTGDMVAATYDPNGVGSDAFDMGNMVEATDAKIMTGAERTKLAGIEEGATANSPDATLLDRANHTGTQSADTITDGTTNKAYTATEQSKLAGIAAGAEANVSPDWDATTGDGAILNKPTLREVLTADRTYYVSPTGSDSNDGLTSGTAFLTLAYACGLIPGALDLSGFNVDVQVAAGSYAGFTFASPQVGAGNITIKGDTTTPSNVTVGPVSVDGAGCRLFIEGLNVAKGTGFFCVQATNGGYLETTGTNQFDSTSGGHRLVAWNGGVIIAAAPEIITGTAGGAHYNSTNNGIIDCSGATWTAPATAIQSWFARCTIGGILVTSLNSSSGTFTGKRYLASLNGVINTAGGGANYFPGSTAGTVDTGGQYA